MIVTKGGDKQYYVIENNALLCEVLILSTILVTTGVMRSDSTMSRIVVEMENTSDRTQEVILNVIDWNSDTPVDLLAPTLIAIPVGEIRVQFIPAENNFAYEVRAKIPGNNKVIVTSFAETESRTLIHGNTVLFPDFNILSTCNSAIQIPLPPPNGLVLEKASERLDGKQIIRKSNSNS
ncbi:MAG: hypothetical protein ACOYIF_02025 [Acetivibrionales bacterium]